jgi:MFS family permease
VAFCVFAALFVWVERRATDPVISFELWGRRAIAAANTAMMLSCMAVMGLTTFLPMYVQGVMHRSPVAAGLALTMVLVGWPVGSTIAARTFTRFGLRPLMIFGSVLLPIGISLLLLLGPDTPVFLAGVSSLVAGFGMGFMGVAALVMIQEIVGVHERGSATASNLFARNLGNTVGATLLGAVFNYGLAHAEGGVVVTSEQIKRLLAAAAEGIQPDAAVEIAMRDSLHLVFMTMVVLSLVVIVATTRAPALTIKRGKPAPKEATSSMH